MEGLINSIIDEQAVQLQIDFLNKELDDLANKIKGFTGIGSNFQPDSNLKQVVQGHTQLATAEKELQKIQDQVAASTAKLTALQTEEAKTLANLKVQRQQANKELDNQAKVANTATGSIENLRARVADLQRQKGEIPTFGEENLAKIDQFNKRIDNLNQIIEKNQDNQSKRKINVGNYEGSAQIIVSALKKVEGEISNLQQKQQGLADLSKTNPIGFKIGGGQENLNQVNAQLDTLKGQFTALNQITTQPEFLNIASKVGDNRREIGFFTKQLVELKEKGLQNTEVFKTVQGRLADLTREVKDAKQNIKALSSETRGFDLFASSVSAVADIFQTGAGAAELFGKNGQEAIEAVRKLVAIQSVANGVREIARQITEKGTAANKAYAFVQTQIATLTNVSTSATQKLSAALKLSGIGLLITGIAFLVDKLGIFKSSEKSAAEAAQTLNEVLQQQNEILSHQVELIAEADQAVIKSLNNQIALSEKSGDGFTKLLALRKQLAIEEKRIADEQLIQTARNVSARDDEVNDTTKALATLLLRQQIYNINYSALLSEAESAAERFNRSQKEDDKKQLDAANNKAQTQKQQIDNINAIINAFTGAQHTIDSLSADEAKFNADERRKLVLESTKIEVDAIKTKNGIILNDERSTLAQRLAALKSNAAAEKREILAEKNNVLTDPSKTDNDRVIATKKANQQIQAVNRNLKNDEFKTNEEFRRRDLAAQKAIIDSEISLRINNNQQIVDDENRSFQERTDAELQIFNDRKKQIDAEKNFELDNAALTLKERLSIEKKGNDDIEVARIEFLKKLKDLQLQDPQIRENRDLSQIDKEKDEQLLALSQQFSEGKILKSKYDQERLKIEQDYSVKSLKKQLDYAQQYLSILKALGIDTSDEEKKIAEIRLAIQDTTNQQIITKHEQLSKKIKDISDKVSTGLNAFSDLFSALSEQQKNAIDEQLDLIDKRKQKEIDAINQTVLSEQEKANKVRLIEARAAADSARLTAEKRRINIQEAKFQKAAQIAKIIGDTASAVVEALPDVVLAAVIGAIGVAELATVVATPIPQYKKGTAFAQGGPSVVAEDGRELGVDPKGKITLYEKPTLTSLIRGTKIIPNQITENILRNRDRGLFGKMNTEISIVSENGNQKELLQTMQVAVTELKELNEKSKITIITQRDITTTAWWEKHIKR